QFKKADKSGAKVAIIICQDDLDKGFAGIKFLQQNEEKQQVAFNELINFLER
ncbi:His/Gly/Thr/Pro-type tRNA ligase C-terminal domain-containing protein, partial [Francisella tularensis]|uniref:His/Gly/Thr/Pro-type tRNA ligase C-terminal domain-containing protein n=1 Tax=Francisella tularensis TaxID=263 RepID=UPI002381A246